MSMKRSILTAQVQHPSACRSLLVGRGDALYDVGAYHECMLAQRHAVPTLADAVTAARRPQIRALLEETSIGSSAESIIPLRLIA